MTSILNPRRALRSRTGARARGGAADRRRGPTLPPAGRPSTRRRPPAAGPGPGRRRRRGPGAVTGPSPTDARAGPRPPLHVRGHTGATAAATGVARGGAAPPSRRPARPAPLGASGATAGSRQGSTGCAPAARGATTRPTARTATATPTPTTASSTGTGPGRRRAGGVTASGGPGAVSVGRRATRGGPGAHGTRSTSTARGRGRARPSARATAVAPTSSGRRRASARPRRRERPRRAPGPGVATTYYAPPSARPPATGPHVRRPQEVVRRAGRGRRRTCRSGAAPTVRAGGDALSPVNLPCVLARGGLGSRQYVDRDDKVDALRLRGSHVSS